MTFNRGFSLVEILIAMVVVVLSGLGTLKLYSYIEVARANSMLWIDAQLIAESQIAIMQRVNTVNGNCHFDNVQKCRLELDKKSPFILKIVPDETLSYSADNAEAVVYAKILNVKVSWTDRNGEEKILNRPVTVSKTTNSLN